MLINIYLTKEGKNGKIKNIGRNANMGIWGSNGCQLKKISCKVNTIQ